MLCKLYYRKQIFAPESGSKLVQGIENPTKLLEDRSISECERLCWENPNCEGVNIIEIDDDYDNCYLLEGFKNLQRYQIVKPKSQTLRPNPLGPAQSNPGPKAQISSKGTGADTKIL